MKQSRKKEDSINKTIQKNRYYEDRYIDEEGNLYYYADEVSWNEKGEIITAENDPNPPVIEDLFP